MNSIEALKIIQLRNIAYPRANASQSREMLQEEVTLYAEIFENEDFKEVEKALKSHMRKSPYPPAISDLKNEIAWRENPKPIDAWLQVQKVIGEYGAWRSSEAMAKLKGSVLEAVKRIGFSELCRMMEKEAKEAFMEVYREIVLKGQVERV